MTYEIFTKQLDGCTYLVDGRPSGGSNCSCAAEADWLYRASQGRIHTTSCHVRSLTGDRSGGTTLDEMQAVSEKYGITLGRVYRPMLFSTLRMILLGGRHGAIVQIGYSAIRGTPYDCFRGNFGGGHAVYASRASSTAARIADPGADGRYAGCPSGYQSYPWSVLANAANKLPIKVDQSTGRILLTLEQDVGPGHVYAYVTPADPIPAYTVHFAHDASIRVYSMKGSCIDAWVDRVWTGTGSTDLAANYTHRRTCDGTSGAYTATLTTGIYAGRVVRVPALGKPALDGVWITRNR